MIVHASSVSIHSSFVVSQPSPGPSRDRLEGGTVTAAAATTPIAISTAAATTATSTPVTVSATAATIPVTESATAATTAVTESTTAATTPTAEPATAGSAGSIIGVPNLVEGVAATAAVATPVTESTAAATVPIAKATTARATKATTATLTATTEVTAPVRLPPLSVPNLGSVPRSDVKVTSHRGWNEGDLLQTHVGGVVVEHANELSLVVDALVEVAEKRCVRLSDVAIVNTFKGLQDGGDMLGALLGSVLDSLVGHVKKRGQQLSVALDGKTRQELPGSMELRLHDEQPTLALLVGTTCATKTVDVLLAVGRGSDLDNVRHVGEVHSTGSDVG